MQMHESCMHVCGAHTPLPPPHTQWDPPVLGADIRPLPILLGGVVPGPENIQQLVIAHLVRICFERGHADTFDVRMYVRLCAHRWGAR